MSINSKIQKLRKRIQNGEFRYIFKRVFPRGNPVFYYSVQYVFQLSNKKKFKTLVDAVRKQCDHTPHIVTPDIFEQLCQDFPHKDQKFRKRMANGCRCYVTMKNDEISAYLWALEPQKDYFDTNSLWRFKPEQMDGNWCFDGFVKPQYRLRGLFPYLMGIMREEYSAKGYSTQYGETDAKNERSLNTHLRVGYEIEWRVLVISILGLKIYFAKNPISGARKINFRYALNIADKEL